MRTRMSSLTPSSLKAELQPRPPRELRVTSAEWEALLCDPVMAARVFFGGRLDAFQACRLRYYWWTQSVIDSSGVGSGKTIVDFLFLCLRCLLIPKHDGAIFYPSLGTGIQSFWDYFRQFSGNPAAKLFVSQLGNPLKVDAGEELDGDGTVHGSECYTAYFRNGNKLLMPAPSIALDSVRAASLTVNTLIIEEWAQIDKMSDAIDKQLIDRCRGASWNQHHAIWGNHIVYTAHAQNRTHPAAPRYFAHQRKIHAGNPMCANISYSYKDFSDLPSDAPGKSFKQHRRNEVTIATGESGDPAVWLGRGLGIWGVSGAGWFSEEAIVEGIKRGKEAGLLPALGKNQFEEKR